MLDKRPSIWYTHKVDRGVSDSKAHSPLGRIRITAVRKARIFDVIVQLDYLAPCRYSLVSKTFSWYEKDLSAILSIGSNSI